MVVFFVFLLTSLPSLGAVARTQNYRDSKFLGLFNVVQFSNSVCNSTSSNEEGICYTSMECRDFGGQAAGSCASGFGVCCVFTQSCRQNRIKPQDVTYFQNDNYPELSTAQDMCFLSIPIKDKNICQIRLDFLEFELDGGSKIDSPCDRDFLEIMSTSGSNSLGVGKLCGNNKGQHLYIPILNQFNPPSLRVMTESRNEENGISSGYRWNIKITQIDCSSKAGMKLMAPVGCLQYFQERRGTVSSFNWSEGNSIQYLPNQDYAICFKRTPSDCELRLKSSEKGPMSIGKFDTKNNNCDSNGCGSSECIEENNGNVESDRIEINSLYLSDEEDNGDATYTIEQIYCGPGLGSIRGMGIISQGKGPFVMSFITDGFPGEVKKDNSREDENKNELGFSINYSLHTTCTKINLKIK